MRNAVVFLCQEHPRAELYSVQLCPRWFRLVFLGNASNQNDGKRDNSIGSASASLFSLLANSHRFDLETSLKQLCCTCSLKGIAVKKVLGFLEKHESENLLLVRFASMFNVISGATQPFRSVHVHLCY